MGFLALYKNIKVVGPDLYIDATLMQTVREIFFWAFCDPYYCNTKATKTLCMPSTSFVKKMAVWGKEERQKTNNNNKKKKKLKSHHNKKTAAISRSKPYF